MRYNLKNETKYNLSEVEGLISGFFPYAHRRLGFNKPVNVRLVSDLNNAADSLGKTGAYSPQAMEISIFVDKRHPKDILRSFSHELVHHTQNCRGEFNRDMDFGEGYAQVDEHMRKMEAEAYLEGQLLLRDWEDKTKKENKTMSNVNLEETVRNTVRSALRRIMEKKSVVEEEALEEEEINEEESLEEESLEEDELNEEDESLEEEEELYETFTSQKNEMLFEQLTKKWAK